VLGGVERLKLFNVAREFLGGFENGWVILNHGRR
jgi:hypothetical protein